MLILFLGIYYVYINILQLQFNFRMGVFMGYFPLNCT